MKLAFILKAGLTTLLLAYPLLVWQGLEHGLIKWVAGGLVVITSIRLLADHHQQLAPLYYLGILCGGLSLLGNDERWLQLYPVLMSLGACLIFTATLIWPPSMIERIARISEPQLDHDGVRWTRNVTLVWCLFFVVNASVATYTVYWADLAMWTLYNGLIAYLLMGVLFAGEFVWRQWACKRKRT